MRTRLVEFADHYWAEYIDKIERATAQLDDDAVWWRPNEHSNSIANLLLHLSGNLRQWVLGGLVGGSAFWGRFPATFAADKTTFSIEFTPQVSGYYILHLEDGDALVKEYISDLQVQPDPLPSGQLIEDVYQALMSVGLTPVEARERLDKLLQSGARFKSVGEALALIYGNKGE